MFLKRVQTLDSPRRGRSSPREKKSLIIDWLVKWRITEPRQFIRNNGTISATLEPRLSPIVQAGVQQEITKRTVRGVLAVERDKGDAGCTQSAGR